MFRRRNGDISIKSDDELRVEIAKDEARAERGGWAVVVGLVLEVVLAAANSLGFGNKTIENWSGVLADCFVAIGVIVEIRFGRKANEGHSELRMRAERETERLKNELSWRRISVQQAKMMSEFLALLPKLSVRILYAAGDPEARSFSNDIIEVFENAGWNTQLISMSSHGNFEGVVIPLYSPPSLEVCGILRSVFANANIVFRGGTPPPAPGTFAAISGEVTEPYGDINVGIRARPRI